MSALVRLRHFPLDIQANALENKRFSVAMGAMNCAGSDIPSGFAFARKRHVAF
jgi:hypothetical protein